MLFVDVSMGHVRTANASASQAVSALLNAMAAIRTQIAQGRLPKYVKIRFLQSALRISFIGI